MYIEAKPEINNLILAKWQNMLDFVANLFGVPISMITKIDNQSTETILSNKGSKETVNNRKTPVAYLGVPIKWPDNEIFGTLAIEDHKAHEFTSRYHDIMTSFEEIVNTDLALLMESKSFEKRRTFNHMSVHHIKSAIIIYDKDNLIKSFNQEAEVITRYSKDEILGHTMTELKESLGLGDQLISDKLYEIESKIGQKKVVLVDISDMDGVDGTPLTVISFTDQTHYMELQTKQNIETGIDDTTGVYNYSGISEILGTEAKRAGRYKHPLSIIVVRIDGYHIMDKMHGENKSDLVLQTLAIILRNETRDVDFIGRLSEDIFVVVLPSTMLEMADMVAGRISKAAINYSDDETPFTVTVATSAIDSYDNVKWLEEAVKILVESKA